MPLASERKRALVLKPQRFRESNLEVKSKEDNGYREKKESFVKKKSVKRKRKQGDHLMFYRNKGVPQS